MATNNLLTVAHFCAHYQVEVSFVEALHSYGLVQVVEQPDGPCISSEDLTEIEKMIHLHYELGINLEGIDAIRNLLRQIADLQQALQTAENKLRRYEEV